MEQTLLNILLVDDDEFFVRIIAAQLREEYKYKITIASNGQKAKELLEKGTDHFDMILTDFEMPEMNGLDLLRWIQGQQIETPVVMLTAAGSEAVAVEAMKLGAYDYVRKEQLDLQHLGIIINATHERRQLRISRTLEEEQTREIGLNIQATDKVRDVLNSITPMLNNALADINGDIELKGEEICSQLPEPSQTNLRKLFHQIQKEVSVLEISIGRLLELYKMLYAHHAEAQGIERLKQEIEEKRKSG